MPSGFKLIHSGEYSRSTGLWTVTEVRFGAHTRWNLRICLSREGEEAELRFESPASFRVQEEGILGHYWSARAAEGIDIGTIYSIGVSEYLAEIKQSTLNPEGLLHYLVAGNDDCVEIVSQSRPVLPDRWRSD